MTRTLTALYIARNSSGSVHGVPYRTLMGDKPLDHYCRDVVLKMGSQSSNVSTHGRN